MLQRYQVFKGSNLNYSSQSGSRIQTVVKEVTNQAELQSYQLFYETEYIIIEYLILIGCCYDSC